MMKLSDLRRVTELRVLRDRADLLCRAAKHGSVGDMDAWHNGNHIGVFNVIDKAPVRDAIADECSAILSKIDKELAALGVEVDRTE